MPLHFRYEFTNNASTDMGNTDFRFGEWALTQNARIGEAAISTLRADDPDGTQDYIGLRQYWAYETSAPSNNQLIYKGRLGRRTVRRNPEKGLITGAAREWELEIGDQSILLGWRFMMAADANRPAETAQERLTWLIDTRRAPIWAHPDYCSAPATAMDAADYRQQRYIDVLASIANMTGWNFWADYSEGRDRTELFFMDPNSSAYAASIHVSNDLADVDSTTIFAPSMDAELTRDPARVAASMLTPYTNGYVYETRDSTGDQFAYIDQTAPDGNIKTAAKAQVVTTRLLDTFDEEDDSVSFSIDVPADQVNDARQGQVMDVKFTHLPGYEAFVPCRISQRTVRQTEELGQDWYQIDYIASPTGATVLSCATSVSSSEDHVSSGNSTSISDTITPTADGMIVAFLLGYNGNVPQGTDITAISGGYTELVRSDDAHKATYAIGYKAASAGVGATASATFTGGWGSYDAWIATQVALPFTSAAPVQTKSNIAAGATSAIFDAAPTPGNIILMFCHGEPYNMGSDMSPGGLGPTDGWTTVGAQSTVYGGNSDGYVMTKIYARCVEEGDGSSYGFAGNWVSNSFSIFLAEYAIT